ncbi:MAG: phosphotransferase [Coprococcus sp.]
MEHVEPDTFGKNGFASPEELYGWLMEHQPKEELTLSHGDFCLPNIFFEGQRLAGFIDLGRMGLADKWQDIALCYRSLLHNYDGIYNGKKYEGFEPGMLFEKLEIEPDWEKIRFYLLLDELF